MTPLIKEALALPVQPAPRNVTEKEDRVLAKALLKSGKVIFPAQPVQPAPSGIHKIGCVNHDCQHCKEMQDWEAVAADQALTIAMMKIEQESVAVWELQETGWESICDGDWLMALPMGTRLYTLPETKTQSFAEKYPRNPDAKCKCEHWEACIDCHPTFVAAVLKGEV